MSNIKCEVARDLMPLMADDVASPGSVELVNEHMEGCETCKAYYAGMKVMLPKSRKDEDDNSFVQFVKKEKKGFRNRKRLLIALIGILLVIVIAFFGVAVVDAKMRSYVDIDIHNVDAAPFVMDDGRLGLLIEPHDGHGWYGQYVCQRYGEIMYIIPREPDWKMWNRGISGSVEEYPIGNLYVEDGKVYAKNKEHYDVYNAEVDIYEDRWRVCMELVEYIRWGSPDNFTTIYETGDTILSYDDLINDNWPEEIGPDLAIGSMLSTPAPTPVVTVQSMPVPTVEATEKPTPEATAKPTGTAKPAA